MGGTDICHMTSGSWCCFLVGVDTGLEGDGIDHFAGNSVSHLLRGAMLNGQE